MNHIEWLKEQIAKNKEIIRKAMPYTETQVEALDTISGAYRDIQILEAVLQMAYDDKHEKRCAERFTKSFVW